MDKREQYYKYFNENILPILYPMEQYRLKTARKVILTSLLMFLAGIFFAFVFVCMSMKSSFVLLSLPIFLFLMYFFFIKSIINVMWTGKQYQKWLVEKILPYFFEPVANFKFWPKNSNTAAIIDSQLFGNFDTQEDASSIFGIYNNTNILISNTELKIPVNHNVFKGTVIQLELPKSINNHVIFISKNEHKFNKYRQVNPHIPNLNKYLYVFAKNPEDTHFINEEFWQIAERFGKLYTAKGFGVSINNDVVLITLRQKYPWQFGFLFKSLLNAKNYDELIERFIVIYDFIDFLCNLI